MTNKVTVVVTAAAVVGILVSAGFGWHEHQTLNVLGAQILACELQPIAALVKENQDLLMGLASEPYSEKDSGILESYLAKIRRNGLSPHAGMKQRLDTIAENNTAIVALIKAYAVHAQTREFASEADKFRDYAAAWRDRWNSVMEIFMAGGNYVRSGMPFPVGFPGAIDAELMTRQ